MTDAISDRELSMLRAAIDKPYTVAALVARVDRAEAAYNTLLPKYERAVEALKPFVEALRRMEDHYRARGIAPSDFPDSEPMTQLSIAPFRAARAALTPASEAGTAPTQQTGGE